LSVETPSPSESASIYGMVPNLEIRRDTDPDSSGQVLKRPLLMARIPDEDMERLTQEVLLEGLGGAELKRDPRLRAVPC
jgi:hypothetical protein